MSRQGRVFKKDDGNWAYDVDTGPSSKDRRRVIRTNFPTRTAALAALEEVKRTSRIAGARSAQTVKDYLTGWAKDRFESGRIRESTARCYVANMAVTAEWFGDLPLSELRAPDLDAFYRHLSTTGGRDGTGRSPSTVNQFHRIIKTALNDAFRKGLIDRNEALNADPPRVARQRLDPDSLWNAGEVRAFLASPWLPENRRIAYTIGFATGLRAGELAGLYWTDIEDDAITVRRARSNGFKGRVYEGYPKSSAAFRTIKMHQQPADLVRQWQEAQASEMLLKDLGPQYVLTNARLGPWNPNGLTRNWIRDARRAVEEGLVSQYANLHKVRHWFGTELAGDPDTDLASVKELMGHGSAAFTIDTYVHGNRERAGRASERVGGQLWGD